MYHYQAVKRRSLMVVQEQDEVHMEVQYIMNKVHKMAREEMPLFSMTSRRNTKVSVEDQVAW
jgi:hypothetical protein